MIKSLILINGNVLSYTLSGVNIPYSQSELIAPESDAKRLNPQIIALFTYTEKNRPSIIIRNIQSGSKSIKYMLSEINSSNSTNLHIDKHYLSVFLNT